MFSVLSYIYNQNKKRQVPKKCKCKYYQCCISLLCLTSVLDFFHVFDSLQHNSKQELLLVDWNILHWGLHISMRKHFALISLPQKGVGSFALPAPCCSFQHEGEKHQEGSDAHPQNQPEPCASGEESKQLPFCLSLPLLINFWHTNHTDYLISDAVSLK